MQVTNKQSNKQIFRCLKFLFFGQTTSIANNVCSSARPPPLVTTTLLQLRCHHILGLPRSLSTSVLGSPTAGSGLCKEAQPPHSSQHNLRARILFHSSLCSQQPHYPAERRYSNIWLKKKRKKIRTGRRKEGRMSGKRQAREAAKDTKFRLSKSVRDRRPLACWMGSFSLVTGPGFIICRLTGLWSTISETPDLYIPVSYCLTKMLIMLVKVRQETPIFSEIFQSQASTTFATSHLCRCHFHPNFVFQE